MSARALLASLDVLPVPDGVKLRRTWPQRLFIALNAWIVLCCFGLAGGLAYLNGKAGELQQINLGQALSETGQEASVTSGPINILMVGVDSAEGLDSGEPVKAEREREGVGGLRSDTIMLLRLDPGTGRIALMSFPRDLWVPIAGTGYREKINAAIGVGGPALLIRTISQNFDIPIDHYVQVDFAQFEQLVDVVDGVRVYFDTPVRDDWTGLDIPEPGCVLLEGRDALAYARSRYFEYYKDGRWRYDETSDLGRIDRQQDFIKRALRRAVTKGIRNPFTLNKLVDTGLSAVTVDDAFSPSDILALATKFRSFDPELLETYALPVVTDTTDGGASIVRLLDKQARPILDIFRGIDPATVEPASTRVRVLNGSGSPGQGRNAADALRKVGFDITEVGDSSSGARAATVIRHGSADAARAELVARYVDGTVQLTESEDLSDGAVELVTGTAFGSIRSTPLAAANVVTGTTTGGTATPVASATSISTVGSAGAASSATAPGTPATTSTTRYGVVPGGTAAASCR